MVISLISYLKAAQEKRTDSMTVLRKSKKLISYQSNQNDIQYFNNLEANKEELLIRVYQRAKFMIAMIRENVSYKFTNLVKKGRDCWLVSSISVAYTASVPTGIFQPH